MKETLTRRVESFSKNPPPDLWVIDGGATLLKLAIEILEAYGVFIDVIAITKEIFARVSITLILRST
jgi:excinuclease ABC subunit C